MSEEKKPEFKTAFTTVTAFRNIYAVNYEKARDGMTEQERTANDVLLDSFDVILQYAVRGASSPGFRGEVVK